MTKRKTKIDPEACETQSLKVEKQLNTCLDTLIKLYDVNKLYPTGFTGALDAALLRAEMMADVFTSSQAEYESALDEMED